MKALIFLSLFCLEARAAEHARFKGFTAVARELSTRIAPRGEPVPLLQYVPAEGLAPLLGTWNNFGGEHVFRNGDPNPVNMLIWHGTFSAFAKALAGGCSRPPFDLNERFARSLAKACAWPRAEAKEQGAMLELWLALMGYNAPESEFAAWRAFLLARYGDRPAGEALEAMGFTILMNPYFLLDR